MNIPHRGTYAILTAGAIATLLASVSCARKDVAHIWSNDLRLKVSQPFHFVAYGDTRFHDPRDTEVANPGIRAALVQAIAKTNPAFVCLTGDIVYNGYDADDWGVWDAETTTWRQKKIPVLPALGTDDLHGDANLALRNYFKRFPEFRQSRFYSVRAANVLILVLDSSLEETAGPQGEWLTATLNDVPLDVDFVFVVLHHPPYTSSSDARKYGGVHLPRLSEQGLARLLEDRQARARFRFVVFSGQVHNYERHEHGGVTYFVTGGGAAHAYPIERAPDDLFQSKAVNYHYLLVEVGHRQLTVTVNRLELVGGKNVWTTPDRVQIGLPPFAKVMKPSSQSTLPRPALPPEPAQS